MDYIKEAEIYLKNYSLLKKSLKHIEKNISIVEKECSPTDNITSTIEITGIRSAKQHNVMNQMYKLIVFENSKNDTKDAIEIINNMLDDLSKEEGYLMHSELLKMYYLKKWDKHAIIRELNISETTFYRYKGEAIRKFALLLFGLPVITSCMGK